MKKNKSNKKWALTVTISAFVISVLLGLITTTVVRDLSVLIAFFVLILVILLGIIFDIIGMAVATAVEAPFHAKSSKRVRGAKESLTLIKNAEKVSSFCNDVIGDIAGVISGGLAATIAISIHTTMPFLTALGANLLMTATVSAVTVGGKALGKNVAITESIFIVEKCGLVIYGFKRIFTKEKR
jgi:hypothetical protein